MEKKNLDWSNLGFGYMKTDRDLLQISKMEHGMTVSLQKMIRS